MQTYRFVVEIDVDRRKRSQLRQRLLAQAIEAALRVARSADIEGAETFDAAVWNIRVQPNPARLQAAAPQLYALLRRLTGSDGLPAADLGALHDEALALLQTVEGA